MRKLSVLLTIGTAIVVAAIATVVLGQDAGGPAQATDPMPWASRGQPESSLAFSTPPPAFGTAGGFPPPTFSVADPQGDTFGFLTFQPDIIEVSGAFDATTFFLTVEFAGPVTPADAFSGTEVVGFIDFDTDQNSGTGSGSLADFFCSELQAPGMPGIEVRANLQSVSGGLVPLVDTATALTLGLAPIAFTGSAFTASIPLSLLGGENAFNFAMVLGSIPEPTDCAPDGTFIKPKPPTPPPPPPLPYVCPETSNLAFPEPGCDGFQSTGTFFANITNPPLGDLVCNVSGPIVVRRLQSPFPFNDTNSNDRRDFQTEILSLDLTGFCDPLGLNFGITVHQIHDPLFPSLGLTEELVAGVGTGDFFPADSFFNVLFEVHSSLTGETIHNALPIPLNCEITGIPVPSCNFVATFGGGPGAAGLCGALTNSEGAGVGCLTGGEVDSGTQDTDFDGCSDTAEGQTTLGSETAGGLRDPFNQWDYYDVNGDGHIDVPNDILKVILSYLLGPGDVPGPGQLPYSADKDRGPAVAGAQFAWQRTGPDGIIEVPNDIIPIILQYLHTCK